MKITISKDGENLYGHATGQGRFPLQAFENNVFTFDDAGIKFIFNTEKKEMLYTQGKIKFLLKKE